LLLSTPRTGDIDGQQAPSLSSNGVAADAGSVVLLLGEIVADVAQLVIGETHLSSSGRSLSKPVFLALPFLPVTRIKSQMNAAWMLRCCAAPCLPHLSRLQRLHSNQRPTAELN